MGVTFFFLISRFFKSWKIVKPRNNFAIFQDLKYREIAKKNVTPPTFWKLLWYLRTPRKKIYIPVFHAGGHCGLRFSHFIDFLTIFWKSLKTREIGTSRWKSRKFRIHQKNVLSRLIFFFCMLMPTPASKSSQTQLKTWFWTQTNHDFRKSRFSKIGRKIMKTGEIGIFFREESDFHHPRGRK